MISSPIGSPVGHPIYTPAYNGVGESGEWVTSFSTTFSSDSAGWNGYNYRNIVAAASLSQSGSKVRLTLEAGAGGATVIDGCYIGHAAAVGDAYDFDGGQMQVTVGGNAAFTIAAGASVVTDEIAFALDETKNLILAMHFNGVTTLRGAALGSSGYYKSAANETATANVTGYSSDGNVTRVVNKIEVFQAS